MSIPFWKSTEPTYVNEQGVKWYFDKQVTEYCFLDNVSGVHLDNVLAYVCELPNGEFHRVLVKDGEVIFSSKSLEEIGVEIDRIKLEKSFDRRN